MGECGEGLVELEGDEGYGFGGEGGVVGGGGGGREGVEAAVELVGQEVAGDGDEEGVGLLEVLGVEAGGEQGGRGVDAFGVAGGCRLAKSAAWVGEAGA